tara:strand:- start:17592 stop:18242 length:651 start_codon:yes stop_codon:yes gene_type:complete
MQSKADTPTKPRIYLITPPKIDLTIFPSTLTQALDGGDVACVQLRLKGSNSEEIKRSTEPLLRICHDRDIPLIINDTPELVEGLGADGVHIGLDDGEYRNARNILGDEYIIGVSCYDSKHRAIVAAEDGADYVAFGAFFHTQTKKARANPNPDILRWWAESTVVPCVAIGGIDQENCNTLLDAGADFIAVINSVWNYPKGPKEAIKKFNALIEGRY